MLKQRYISDRHSRGANEMRATNRRAVRGFTLIELLVAVAVLSLMMVIFIQVAQNTVNATHLTEKQIDMASMSRIALDRIGSSLSAMVKSGAATAIVIKDIPDSINDGLVLITQGRDRFRSGISDPSSIRLIAHGYRIAPTQDTQLSVSIPMLNWGDGSVVFATANASAANGYPDVVSAMSAAVNDTATATPGTSFLTHEMLAQGIFRFEICFLLSDGRIVNTGNGGSGNGSSLPPKNKNFSDFQAFANYYPLAFSATDSVHPNKIYVRAFIIGIAVLDEQTMRLLVNTNGSSALQSLGDALPNPPPNQTPLQAWNLQNPNSQASRNLRAMNLPAPVRNSIRSYQRFYYVQ